MSQKDTQRILRELKKSRAENSDELWLEVLDDDIRLWHGVIKGNPGTPFEGFYYELSITIPSSYPIQPPTAKFITPIFHPNIKLPTGDICLNILADDWTPAWGISSLVSAIRLLMDNPAPDSPLNVLAANLLKYKDEVGYRSMAMLYNKRYALRENILKTKSERSK